MDHSFTLQAVMEMQKSLGQLTQAVNSLTEQTKENSEEIKTIGRQVYAARVVVTIVGSIVGGIYVLCEIWKTISPYLQIKPPTI
jgi:hypothetical protein